MDFPPFYATAITVGASGKLEQVLCVREHYCGVQGCSLVLAVPSVWGENVKNLQLLNGEKEKHNKEGKERKRSTREERD